jgi:hypothetical protein
MSYMLLIVEPRGQRRTRTDAQGHDLYQRMVDYTNSLKQRGVLVASDSLKSEAVRFEKQDGKEQLLDGPFTESKELIGGFFLIDCDTRAEALRFADECPAAEWATIEVRETGPCYD